MKNAFHNAKVITQTSHLFLILFLNEIITSGGNLKILSHIGSFGWVLSPILSYSIYFWILTSLSSLIISCQYSSWFSTPLGIKFLYIFKSSYEVSGLACYSNFLISLSFFVIRLSSSNLLMYFNIDILMARRVRPLSLRLYFLLS